MIPIFKETKLEEIDAFMKKYYVRRGPRRFNNPKTNEFASNASQPPKLVSNPGKSVSGSADNSQPPAQKPAPKAK